MERASSSRFSMRDESTEPMIDDSVSVALVQLNARKTNQFKHRALFPITLTMRNIENSRTSDVSKMRLPSDSSMMGKLAKLSHAPYRSRSTGGRSLKVLRGFISASKLLWNDRRKTRQHF